MGMFFNQRTKNFQVQNICKIIHGKKIKSSDRQIAEEKRSEKVPDIVNITSEIKMFPSS
jgi:hypothetical protein